MIDYNILDTSLKQEIDSKYRNINSGGCGKFALILGKRLAKEGVPFKYVLLTNHMDTPKERFNLFKEDVREGNMQHTSKIRWTIAHIMVYSNGYLIDCTGIYKTIPERWEHWAIGGFLPDKILQSWCRQKGWNRTFDVSQLPSIRKRVYKLKLR